ncbi:MAG: CpaF family protein [Candidatus Diapherotrites archaeon]|nr:CpaF family protein [Candidatus Diapherotrites archaeon]
MALDPLAYAKILEGKPYGSYAILAPDLSEEEKKLLEALTLVLSGKKSLNQLDLSFLGEKREDFVTLVRESILKIPPRKLYSPQELLAIAEDLHEDLKVIGFEEPFISIKAVYDGLGLGDLEFPLYDPSIEEILVNGRKSTFLYHGELGYLEGELNFDLREVARRLLRYLGKGSSLIDGHLPDGSRINVVLEPVSDVGTSITIRKFKRRRLSLLDIIKRGTMSTELAAYLWLLIEGMGVVPHNLIVAGNTGGGKTTTLNALLDLVPLNERIISIEDTRELSLLHPNWVPLSKEYDDVALEDLLINALRMRPDRIVVGEVRGREAETLLAAMNVGHAGMGTIHANSARDSIRRLTSPPMEVPREMLPVLNLVLVQHRIRTPKGYVRRVTEVAEIAPLEGGVNIARTFVWDPSTDEIKRTEIPSALIDKMSEYLSLSKKKIQEELRRRQKIIEYALKENLDRLKFISLVNSYYLNPSGVK